MIKYLGSKRKLLPAIVDAVRAFGPDVSTVLDLFSGTSRVGHALKGGGYRVVANDHNAYAHALATCYVATDREDVEREALQLIAEMNAFAGSPGWFTETFCERARYFQPKNGARIDRIRDEIERRALPVELRAVLLVSLMEAADRVDSTTGVQMAYLKQWAPRAHNDLELRLPDVRPRVAAGKCGAHGLDALDAVASIEADLVYLDPPYNQHSYLGNYHVWESLVRWDKPPVYGVANKRIDVRDRRSRFNSKRACKEALAAIIAAVRAPRLLVSFSNEGYVTRRDLEEMLATRGEVSVISCDYKRYVGAQIGIHNHLGVKVGTVSHLSNVEHLFVVTPTKPKRRPVRGEASLGA